MDLDVLVYTAWVVEIHVSLLVEMIQHLRHLVKVIRGR